jgi:hypothetical protein
MVATTATTISQAVLGTDRSLVHSARMVRAARALLDIATP